MESAAAKEVGFATMGLDDRLLKAISWLGWNKPTLVQEKAIPLALEGKDILARARTGTGKTGAMTIPMLQKLLLRKKLKNQRCISTLILAPSKELSTQIHSNIVGLTRCCQRDVRVLDISSDCDIDEQKQLLKDLPDIVIGTPKRIASHIKAANMLLDQLNTVCLDEADLLFSLGFESDVKFIIDKLPSVYQAFMMSATFNSNVKSIRKVILHNPVVLKLKESRLPESNQLDQFHIVCKDDLDKFLIICAIYKLKLLRGRSIIFVSSVDRCYKVKLFLDLFNVKCCVLNGELPLETRCHVVSEFNGLKYNHIVATDTKAKGSEYCVSRGIDFQQVDNVVNLDLPKDLTGYIHRIGRTARGERCGTAVSLTLPEQLPLLRSIEEALSSELEQNETVVKSFTFKMEEIEGLRYRVEDAYRSVNKHAVFQCRMKEIRAEMINSIKLKTFFDENPRDLQLLRQDRQRKPNRLKQHLQHIPDYLVPQGLKDLQVDEPKNEAKEVRESKKRRKKNRKRKRTEESVPRRNTEEASKRKAKRPRLTDKDPLRSLKIGDRKL